MISTALAAGLFLTVVGLAALGFGLYALLRGGRGQSGGIGPPLRTGRPRRRRHPDAGSF
jgi:hypothetical protein